MVKKKIRILQCIRQGQIGGGESHLLSLVENLDKNIFEPIILSFTPGPMIEKLKQMGIQTHIIHTETPFDIFKWSKVKKILKDEKIDLVHAHGTRANSNVFWPAKSLNIPLIYTIHGWSFHNDQNPLLKKLRILSEQLLTSKMDVNISVSKSNQETGFENIKGFKSVIINYGIDLEKFNPDRKFNDIRKELGISNNKILLLFIARFTTQKQPLSLIKAFALALKKCPNLILLMVGDGDQKARSLELAKELKIKDQIIFENFRLDVPDVLAAADIFILPSLWEGLPIGLLEAMCMGKAIITTKVDGTSEIIENNQNGLLINLGNLSNDLANAIVLLSENKELRDKFISNSKITVQNKFNASIMTKKIENIYLGLIKTIK